MKIANYRTFLSCNEKTFRFQKTTLTHPRKKLWSIHCKFKPNSPVGINCDISSNRVCKIYYIQCFPRCNNINCFLERFTQKNCLHFIKTYLHEGAITFSLTSANYHNLTNLTLSWRRPLSYRDQSIDLLCKSMDWFLYDNGDNGLRHERVKGISQWIIFRSRTISITLRNWKFHQSYESIYINFTLWTNI